jgi:two-component system response regulator QseB
MSIRQGGKMSDRVRILVADDEEGIRESISLILGDRYDLVFAQDGEETLDKLRRETFGLALLDVKMPKLDGLEVLRRLKDSKQATPPVGSVPAAHVVRSSPW